MRLDIVSWSVPREFVIFLQHLAGDSNYDKRARTTPNFRGGGC